MIILLLLLYSCTKLQVCKAFVKRTSTNSRLTSFTNRIKQFSSEKMQPVNKKRPLQGRSNKQHLQQMHIELTCYKVSCLEPKSEISLIVFL